MGVEVITNRGEGMGIGEFIAITDEVRAGRPRRYIESFLKVRDLEGRLVPFRFKENQEYYYQETFSKLKSYNEGFWAYVVKDRKALSTSFWGACCFSFLANVPGFNGVIIGALDEHAAQVLDLFDVFYDNLPEAKDEAGQYLYRPVKTHWDQSLREFGFGVFSAGGFEVRSRSSVMISTSRSTTFGLGRTPKMIWFIEKSRFSQEHEGKLMSAVLNSVTGVPHWRIDDTTPNGTKNGHYQDFRSIKAGDVGAIYLFRRWFDNPSNRYEVSDPAVLPRDRREMERAGVLKYLDEERRLILEFPQDGVKAHERILWRRQKMAEAIRNALGNEIEGRMGFLQEHVENDTDCWSDIGNPQFDVYMLRRMADSCVLPLSAEKVQEMGLGVVPAPGLELRVWQLPYAAGRYYGGMDLAKGQVSGDASCLEVFDARSGTFVAELWGRPRLSVALTSGAKVMEKYNMGVFAPEATGLGEGAVDSFRDYGYPRLYYRENKSGLSQGRMDRLSDRSWGWQTSGPSKSRMISDFQDAVAEGRISIPNIDLVREIQQWNPQEDKHTADRVMAAMISYAVSLEGHRFPGSSFQRLEGGGMGRGSIVIQVPPPMSPWL